MISVSTRCGSILHAHRLRARGSSEKMCESRGCLLRAIQLGFTGAMAIARHKTRQRELREARALVRRVQRGEPRAFALLYATYEGRSIASATA